jgi:hypothetical protein
MGHLGFDIQASAERLAERDVDGEGRLVENGVAIQDKYS